MIEKLLLITTGTGGSVDATKAKLNELITFTDKLSHQVDALQEAVNKLEKNAVQKDSRISHALLDDASLESSLNN